MTIVVNFGKGLILFLTIFGQSECSMVYSQRLVCTSISFHKKFGLHQTYKNCYPEVMFKANSNKVCDRQIDRQAASQAGR